MAEGNGVDVAAGVAVEAGGETDAAKASSAVGWELPGWTPNATASMTPTMAMGMR